VERPRGRAESRKRVRADRSIPAEDQIDGASMGEEGRGREERLATSIDFMMVSDNEAITPI